MGHAILHGKPFSNLLVNILGSVSEIQIGREPYCINCVIKTNGPNIIDPWDTQHFTS